MTNLNQEYADRISSLMREQRRQFGADRELRREWVELCSPYRVGADAVVPAGYTASGLGFRVSEVHAAYGESRSGIGWYWQVVGVLVTVSGVENRVSFGVLMDPQPEVDPYVD